MDIKEKLHKAILQSLGGKYSLYVFQMLSLAVLSRIFTPEMFGTIATFQVFILFFQLLATSGLAPAIIYQDKMENESRDGVFSVTLIIGLVGALLFFILTPYVAIWLNLLDVNALSWVLSFNVFFSALSMLPMAALQKDTKFLLIARAEIIAEVCSLAICIGLYYLGYGLEALASKLLFVPVFRFVFYYVSSNTTTIGKPSLGKHLSAVRTLVKIAKYQLGFNVLNFFSRNLDTLLITKYFGVSTVGMYEKSYQIMRYPLQLFTFAITPALQPILTKYKEQPSVVEEEFYSVAFKLAALGFFTSMVLYWSTYDVVFIMFGPQWQQAADILRILTITIPLQMVLSATGGVYQAFGATKQLLYCGLFSSITNVSAILFGIYSGDIKQLCLFLAVSFSLNYFQCFYLLHKNIFKSNSVKQFGLLSMVLFSVYLNLFFIDIDIYQHAGFVNAFTSSLLISVFVLSCMTGLYFISRRCLEK